MPLYEYECDRGHRFERIVKFSDPPLELCPECGAPVRKLMSSPAIQFKGTGWYITDYARKGNDGKESEGSKDSKSAGESGGESKSKDTKESKDSKESTAEKPAADSSGAKKAETASTPSTKSD